jgi:hypothetical protein
MPPTPYGELVKQLRAAQRECEALAAERKRIAERLELAEAQARTARAARDAALSLACWVRSRRDEA